MSLPREYLDALNELNRDVQLQQPADVLQFCANFFLLKLEEQRKQLLSAGELQRGASGNGANDEGPLLFKQPFTNDDPHSKSHDAHDPHDPHSQPKEKEQGIFKTGFEVGEENKSTINATVDPFASNDNGDQFHRANAFAALQARRTSQSVQPVPHNIPTTFNANRRTSVSAETLNPDGIKDDWKPPVIPKTTDQLERLSKSVIKNFLFSSLDEDSLKTVIDALKEVKLPKGSEIIKQGDEGDFFYVVESGNVEFFVNDEKVSESSSGSSFGELALMYNSPRAATVLAKTDVILWALDRLTFRRILLAKTSKKRQLYESFLKEVPVLSNLSLFERSKLADALDTENYKSGEVIIKEGEIGENFYLIIKGTADVVKSGEGKVNSLKRGDYFGEIALLNDLPRQATVVSTSDVDVATLDKRGFQRLLGPAVEVLKRQDPTRH
jgi:cAMP-dependent protein kinase regulator